MDLRFAGLAPTAAEQAALDRLLGAPLDGWRGDGALGRARPLVLPAALARHGATRRARPGGPHGGGTEEGPGGRGGRPAVAPEAPVGAAVPQAGDPRLILLRRVGVVDPGSLDDYRYHGGYEAVRRAVKLGPAGVIREVTDSGL